MKITHPQFHGRRGWSLCSWCGAYAAEDRQTQGPTVRETEEQTKKWGTEKSNMFAIIPRSNEKTSNHFISAVVTKVYTLYIHTLKKRYNE